MTVSIGQGVRHQGRHHLTTIDYRRRYEPVRAFSPRVSFARACATLFDAPALTTVGGAIQSFKRYL